MKKLVLLLGFVAFFSISCDKDDPSNCCVIMDTGVTIKYVNETGENLLEKDGALSIKDITLFHKVDSEWEQYFKGNLDIPTGLEEVSMPEGKYLGIATSLDVDENNISETKIRFSETDEDIIKTKLNFSSNNTIVDKVWYNRELKWERTNKNPRNFVIVK
ncbi:hypothetical protein SAMN05444483_103249 [Salegentibacter echinorum]|uniref:Uncharacterized protein n=1 Tax=Salegentibacter echinorum TaxID=1073325 RepID=A0A1M5FLW2_SALEC|nr:hypothetical protein [Salegentibacter echinorum]SHF92414.1 hypothetical protein SAMN05444483_103249 [Salegentibacter echinorum]